MSEFQKITKRDRPDALRAPAARHAEHLQWALRIAAVRARRSKPLVRELLATASIEGLADGLDAKVAAVGFKVPHIGQTWHQLLPWEALQGERPAATAAIIAGPLRESIRRCAANRPSAA
ncbi:hypothetical protein [Scleromatobacter humisilvae]|uniref:Uncharacterized protein n=1 Tax=Scleromatobacter humisilvae TaxID=2897159 RepID=A0A9X1YJ22_9BURK|nr:hypothetical protein [Scleromatobacter humisilvae]MCK9687068.1 hypothetical protein [Scleromatobacter humisilvae]